MIMLFLSTILSREQVAKDLVARTRFSQTVGESKRLLSTKYLILVSKHSSNSYTSCYLISENIEEIVRTINVLADHAWNNW